jgi:nickel-dependent lactate racemase
MSEPDELDICGSGSPESSLSTDELAGILERSLRHIAGNSRVLAIIPDKTRDDNTHQLFPLAAGILSRRNIAAFDALVAQGTHAPMNHAQKLTKVGISGADEIPILGGIFDHEWDDPSELISIGELSSEQVVEITNGLIDTPIDLTINRRISRDHYDHILVFGATGPHEVAGFSGGAKYFFPGVSGADLTNATHWVGALAGIENTIGHVETPARHLIEAAADHIAPDVVCLTSVCSRNVRGELVTHALFGGDQRLSFRKAAAVSRAVHIRYTGRKYKRVIAVLDEHYDELWTGGKASYKLGGIIDEGGELIIYAPHLRCASDTHGRLIEKYGYAPIERVKEMVASSPDLAKNLGVAAHLAHVAYAGCDASGGLEPRYRISLASQIDKETCKKINLKYLDVDGFSIDEYRDEPDALVVERAGQYLYMV